MNKEKGIWISDEILSNKNLTLGEKVLLSIYRNYTLNGTEHCCLLTNDKLGEMIGVTDRQIRNYKQHLKDLDLIETNGGIKVWFKGHQNDTHNNDAKNQGAETDFRHNSVDDTEGGNTLPGGGNEFPSMAETDFRHNKERIKKEKKENKGPIEHKCNTSNISTSIGETNPLFKVLVDCDDENDNLKALLYLDQHFTNGNIEYTKQWWRNNTDWLVELDRFCSHKA